MVWDTGICCTQANLGLIPHLLDQQLFCLELTQRPRDTVNWSFTEQRELKFYTNTFSQKALKEDKLD